MTRDKDWNHLVELEPDRLWTCKINLRFLWLPIGARMTVIKFPNKELFIHSPVGLNDRIKRQLSELGQVKYVVSPNSLHHLFMADFMDAYPSAMFYAPPGLIEKRKDLDFNRQLKDAPEPEWSPYLDQLILAGASHLREAVFFHKETRTLIVGDLIMHFGEDASIIMKLLLKAFGAYGRPFSTIDSKKLDGTEKDLVKYSLQRILAWDFDRIILSHGQMILSDGKQVLRDVFVRLL